MNSAKPRLIELKEYSTVEFSPEPVLDNAWKLLWQDYSKQVEVNFPSLKTSEQWQLTSQGWVGYIPLTEEISLKLQPKVELKDLFGMLEYAYKEIVFPEGLITCQSLEEFYEQLANVLAQRILERSCKGFYRAYVSQTGKLTHLRGRMNVRQAIQKPWDIKLNCYYEEHTTDVEENQILAWTLFIIGRSDLCSERVSPTVRQAYHSLQGFVTLQPRSSKDCVGRLYNRLNEDYRPLHALCRFFLESSGASHERGDRAMLPFLVDMAKLYELFVAEWLQENPPPGFFFKKQHPVEIGQNRHFRIDLLLYHVATGEARAVLDTKYKAPDRAADTDIHQMISYAKATRCSEAFLIYPTHLKEPLDIIASDIRVRSLTLSLSSDLHRAGQSLLEDLLLLC